MSHSPPTFRRSIARFRRRAVAVFGLGLIAAAGIAAHWPASSYSEAPAAASLAAAADAPLPPQAEDKSSSQRALLVQRQAELQLKLGDLDSLLKQIESEQDVRKGKIASLTAHLTQPAPAPATLEVNSPPPPPDELHDQLAALRLREHQLAAKMRDNHPQLQSLRQQIADLQAGRREPARQPAVLKAPTPAPQPLAAAMLAAERTGAELLAAERQSLLAARAELQRQLARIDSELTALVARSDRAIASMPKPSLPDTSVASRPLAGAVSLPRATFGAAELPPGRAVILAAGVLLAGLLGLGTAIVSAFRNPLIRNSRQLESVWDLPLAGTIPPDLRFIPAAA